METSGNVFIASESGESQALLPKDKWLPKDKRRAILHSLVGSIDDPTLVEPAEGEYESPKDWGG